MQRPQGTPNTMGLEYFQRKDHDRPAMTSLCVFVVTTLSYMPSKFCCNEYVFKWFPSYVWYDKEVFCKCFLALADCVLDSIFASRVVQGFLLLGDMLWQMVLFFFVCFLNADCLLEPDQTSWLIIHHAKSKLISWQYTLNFSFSLSTVQAMQRPKGTPNTMGLDHFHEFSSNSTKGQKLCRADANS